MKENFNITYRLDFHGRSYQSKILNDRNSKGQINLKNHIFTIIYIQIVRLLNAKRTCI